MGREAERRQDSAYFLLVVAFVQTQALRLLRHGLSLKVKAKQLNQTLKSSPTCCVTTCGLSYATRESRPFSRPERKS